MCTAGALNGVAGVENTLSCGSNAGITILTIHNSAFVGNTDPKLTDLVFARTLQTATGFSAFALPTEFSVSTSRALSRIRRDFGDLLAACIIAEFRVVNLTITVVVHCITTDLFLGLTRLCVTGGAILCFVADKATFRFAGSLTDGAGFAFVSKRFIHLAITIVVESVAKLC